MEKEDTVVFFHAGFKTTAKIIETNPKGYSINYLYKAIGEDKTIYLVKKESLFKEN